MKRSETGGRVTGRGLLVVGACASVVMIAVACGGKVTWVEDGPQNTGGASSGTPSTGSKISTTSTTSKASTVSASTGIGSSACEKLCMNPACALGGNCVAECIAGFYVSGCEAQADAFLECAVANVDESCELETTACDGVQSTYQQCVGASGCTDESCDGGNGFCQCSGTCFGTKVSAVCKEGPMGPVCSCAINGMEVATCSGGTLSCGLEDGCCAPFFQTFD